MKAERLNGPVLSLFRMVIGVLFFLHGVSSIFGIFGGNAGTGRALEVGAWPGWWAALIQLVCGGLVMLGLFTRPAAVLASGSMAYAYFVVHLPQDFVPLLNGGERAAMFCWSFFLIAVLGPGPWALDRFLRRAGRLHVHGRGQLRPPVPLPKQGRAERAPGRQRVDRT